MSVPILLCDTKGMDRERWLECRAHGPNGDIEYAIGGSDVSIVFGENPWTTPLELWRLKKDLMSLNDAENANQKEMGRLMEPIVAHWYQRKTGNTVTEDTGLYQHHKYPYALANIDFRSLDKSGSKGGLECKFTTYYKASEWADDALPHYYELQGRFYMAVMDWDYIDITCMWGNNPDRDMAIRRINRDLVIEGMIFEGLDAFIESLRSNTPPDMSGVDPELALKALARVYGASQPELPTIEFGKKHEKALRRIAALQEDKSDLERRVKENEKEATALAVKIVEMMGTHEHGILETSTDRLIVDYVTKNTRRVNSDILKKDHPVIYEAVLKTTSSRKLKVSVQTI